jgi:hypothetical protein
MAVLHDIKCAPCGQVETNVLCRRDAGGLTLIPSCPQCGGDRSWIPTTITVPSTSRREAARDVREHYKPGAGGFAQKYSKERESDHLEARRKGDLGNQAEFADLIPLTSAEVVEFDKRHKDDP